MVIQHLTDQLKKPFPVNFGWENYLHHEGLPCFIANQENIYVTQPSLPPLEEFVHHLQKIWDNKILTNAGPFHQQLEQALCDYLGVKHIALFTN